MKWSLSQTNSAADENETKWWFDGENCHDNCDSNDKNDKFVNSDD